MKKFLSIFLALLLLMSSVVSVSALSLKEPNDATLLFPENKVSVQGNTITLTDNIHGVAAGVQNPGGYLDHNDPIVFESGTYVVNLNGFTISPSVDGGPCFIIKSGTNVTVKADEDSTGDLYGMISVEQGATFVADNIYINGDIDSDGTVTLNNASVSSFTTSRGTITINNSNCYGGITIESGKAYINGGVFGGISQFDGEMYITDCETSSGANGLYIDRNADVTVLSGGKFLPFETGDPEFPYIEGVALDVAAPEGTVFTQDYIDKFVPDGYRVVCDGFTSRDVGFDDKTGLLDWFVAYNMVQILPTPDKYSDVMKKITDSTVWTVVANPPEDSGDSEFLLSAIARSLINDKNYEVWAVCGDEPFNPNRATIHIRDLTTNEKQEYYVDVEYKTPDAEIQKLVDKKLEVMKSTDGEWKFYDLDDLYLVNYLTTIKDGGVEGHEAINFARDFINDVGGGKFTFGMDTRLGGGPGMFMHYEGGHTIILYDGAVYATTEGGVTYKFVIYIPEDTEDTAEAYLAAAQKRIKDYFGENSDISLEIGGTLSGLNQQDLAAEQEEIGFTNAVDNYFVLTVGGIPCGFVISKDDDKLATPTYKGSDLINNIKISTTDKSVPFDTQLNAESIKNDTIKKALGTENYVAYDITLYSSSLGNNITKLEDGKFYVEIPLPEGWDTKQLSVLYVNNEGKTEEHAIENDYKSDQFVRFGTDHFSTYALVEKTATGGSAGEAESAPATPEIPKTGDNNNVALWILVMAISLLGGLVSVKRIKALEKQFITKYGTYQKVCAVSFRFNFSFYSK